MIGNVLVPVVLAALLPPGPLRAEVLLAPPDVATTAPAAGATCGLVAVTQPAGSHTAVLWGGPLVATTPGATIQVTCSVQLGLHQHSAPDALRSPSPHDLQQTETFSEDVRYPAGRDEAVYVCTRVMVDGSVRYWDAWSQAWSASDTAPCRNATAMLGGLVDPVWLLLDEHLCDAALRNLDGSVLDSYPLRVDDADLYVGEERVWNCPPYEE
jgi:hypothetical protein